jgi:propionate CoA-transferase
LAIAGKQGAMIKTMRWTLWPYTPGMDLQRDVLAQCATPIAVASDLQLMDRRIYCAEAMCPASINGANY